MNTNAPTPATAQNQPRKEFLSIYEACDLIGCDRRFIDSRIKAGELAIVRLSARLIRIRRTELDRWVEQFTYGGTMGTA